VTSSFFLYELSERAKGCTLRGLGIFAGAWGSVKLRFFAFEKAMLSDFSRG